jgi:hypothetical protein
MNAAGETTTIIWGMKVKELATILLSWIEVVPEKIMNMWFVGSALFNFVRSLSNSAINTRNNKVICTTTHFVSGCWWRKENEHYSWLELYQASNIGIINAMCFGI